MFDCKSVKQSSSTGTANKKLIQNVYPFLTPSGKGNTERVTRDITKTGEWERAAYRHSTVFTFSIPEHCDNLRSYLSVNDLTCTGSDLPLRMKFHALVRSVQW